MLDNQDSPHQIAESLDAIASPPAPPGPELADLIAEDQAGTEHADLLADDALLTELHSLTPGEVPDGDERLVDALRALRGDVDAVPIPDDDDVLALAEQAQPVTPPDEVIARWGRLMSPDGEDDDPVPVVFARTSRGEILLGDMVLPLDVAAQLAERILSAVAYQRGVR